MSGPASTWTVADRQTILICNQPTKSKSQVHSEILLQSNSTQPGHPFMGRSTDYQQKLVQKQALVSYPWFCSGSFYLPEGKGNDVPWPGKDFTFTCLCSSHFCCYCCMQVHLAIEMISRFLYRRLSLTLIDFLFGIRTVEKGCFLSSLAVH